VSDDDITRVRAHGWSDEQLLEAVWVACLFNAIVRLADALVCTGLVNWLKARVTAAVLA
jgi:alkylhydroperoxidase family enzyme